MTLPTTRDPPIPVRIRLDGVVLDGDLVVPPLAEGIVLFAHGSGSGRYSPRNRRVAGDLNAAGFATLLLDLLTASEERWDATTAALRFDIPFLARRLVAATDWIGANPTTSDLEIGYFGASTGAAAALIAAVDRPLVRAVVSRGGRPDLAAPVLGRVKAPTLLIVGGDDTQVIDLNRQALGQLRCVKALEIVPHATHLFEEPGALEQVTKLARDWYRRFLTAASPPGVAG
jgi:dienelactone hydrolase